MPLPVQGQDITMKRDVPLKDLTIKQEVLISYKMAAACRMCKGLGYKIDWARKEPCRHCRSKGFTHQDDAAFISIDPQRLKNRHYSVVLPGYGDEGLEGKNRGDLILELAGVFPSYINTPHGHYLSPLFSNNGNELQSIQFISAIDARYGGEFILPTLAGTYKATLPGGIQNGAKLRLEGEGLYENGKRGDLVYTLRVRPGRHEEKVLARLDELEAQHKETPALQPGSAPPPEEIDFPGGSVPSLVKDLLPAIDSLEKALDAMQATGDSAHRDGLAMILSMKRDALAQHGVHRVPAIGERFNPHVHHAVAVDTNSGLEKGLVSDVLQEGYTYSGHLLRASMVRVAG